MMGNWCDFCRYVMEHTLAQMGDTIRCRKYNQDIKAKAVCEEMPKYERLEECILYGGQENTNIGYNSHGCLSYWGEVRDLEVCDRGNFSEEDAAWWEEIYSLKEDSQVIWLTRHKEIAVSYKIFGDGYDAFMSLSMDMVNKAIENNEELTPYKFDLNDFIRMNGTEDGDGGCLYKLREVDERNE